MNFFLCIDGGGTRTRAGLYGADGVLLREYEAPPSNPLSCGEAQTLRVIRETAAALGVAPEDEVALAVGLAGAGNAAWREGFARRIVAVLPMARSMRLTTDLDPMLHANAPEGPAIFAIAGTGSSVLGKTVHGQVFRFGGRGTVFGDEGSAYAVAVRALRSAAHAQDGTGEATRLERELPLALGHSSIDNLVAWSLGAGKQEIAALAKVVDAAAAQGDAVARNCLEQEAELLAKLVGAAAEKLGQPGAFPVFLGGGLVEKSALFRGFLAQHLERFGLGIAACPPPFHGHRALLYLAQLPQNPDWSNECGRAEEVAGGASRLECAETPPLDALTAEEIIRVMCGADAALVPALAAQSENIAECIEAGAHALRMGGRIIYVGAGTSGRLGALDASECPPTFGVLPDRVRAVVAGGDSAITQSVEGAEDDVEQAARDMAVLKLCADDFVLGIAASGTTPYTRRALECAKGQNARTALLCCNPAVRDGADMVVALDTGAEVLPGSTRLKAGTATKMALNMISTGAMARAGYIYRGRMVFMRPANEKLRGRAARMVQELCGLGAEEARGLLERADWETATALVMHARGCDVVAARAALRDSPDVLQELPPGSGG